LKFTLWSTRTSDGSTEAIAKVKHSVEIDDPAADLTIYTHGGPPRWPQILQTKSVTTPGNGAFIVDVLSRPTNNPWLAQLRFSGLDFYEDGKSMVVTSWDGDAWRVRGIDDPEGILSWQRIASGLFQPLGVKIVDGLIYITCRDQIVILHDLNGDGETDYYENFNNDHQVTDHFHEFAMGLQVDDQGNFYYAKSARHALPALVPHHGTLLRVSADGSHTDILAKGFRAANGVCLNGDGTFFVTDQEGHWTPKNRVNLVRVGGFYGNMMAYHDVTDTSDEAMEQPLCWITNAFDRSPAELLWVTSKQWGPLYGSLLSLSYGYGKIFIVPHESVDGQMQGGMCELPLPQFPTGLIRGRFHPSSGDLYACGMFAWAGTQQQPGGLYRIRYTGKPAHVPLKLSATKRGITIGFSDPFDRQDATNIENYHVRVWALKRTKNYRSDHYNEHELKISRVLVSNDGKTINLEIPDIAPTWCMSIRYELQTPNGELIRGEIDNTIHKLND